MTWRVHVSLRTSLHGRNQPCKSASLRANAHKCLHAYSKARVNARKLRNVYARTLVKQWAIKFTKTCRKIGSRFIVLHYAAVCDRFESLADLLCSLPPPPFVNENTRIRRSVAKHSVTRCISLNHTTFMHVCMRTRACVSVCPTRSACMYMCVYVSVRAHAR